MSLTRLQITTNDPTRLLDSWNALGDVPVAAAIEDDGTVVLSIDLTDPEPVPADEPVVHDGRCRYCGCTDDAPRDPPCAWAEPGLCTACWALNRHRAPGGPVPADDPPAPEPDPEEAFVSADPPAQAAQAAPAFPPAVDLAGSCIDAVVALLDAEPDVAFTTGQIADALAGRYKASTVKFTVNQLAGTRITRVRPGLYQSMAAA